MKTIQITIAGLLLASSVTVQAGDSSEKIPAPTLQLRAAGTLPQPQQIVVSSQIPSVKVEMVPVADPSDQQRYGRYEAGLSPTEEDAREQANAPSLTVVR